MTDKRTILAAQATYVRAATHLAYLEADEWAYSTGLGQAMREAREEFLAARAELRRLGASIPWED